MATAAGWFSDPYGRYEQRYWDGTAWTEHVSTQGTQSVDPLGDSTVIPIVTPTTAFEVPDVHRRPRRVATQTTQPRKFLDSLGPDARDSARAAVVGRAGRWRRRTRGAGRRPR